MRVRRPGLGDGVRSAVTLPLSPFGSEGPQGLSHRVGSTRSPRGRWLSTGGLLRSSSGPAPYLSHLPNVLADCLCTACHHRPAPHHEGGRCRISDFVFLLHPLLLLSGRVPAP